MTIPLLYFRGKHCLNCSNFLDRYTFIDVFNGGRRLTWLEARALLHPHMQFNAESFGATSPLSAAQRMLRNLISIGRKKIFWLVEPVDAS